MKKKILRILAIFLLLIVALLIAVPFFLEAKIGDIIKNNVNSNVNAHLDFTDARLSLISSFPNAQVTFENVALLNHAPFEGDTLFAARRIGLKMGLGELFKSQGDPIGIKNFQVESATLNIKIDSAENANYVIAKESEVTDVAEQSSDSFSFNLESYGITESEISYADLATGIRLVLSDFQHSGTGDLSLETSELDTETQTLVTFGMGGTNYLNRNMLKLDALIGIDLQENKYTFLKNEALVNQLPLIFDGFVKLNENNQEVAIGFETPSSDFKNFLAVIPEEYSKNIENVRTTGNFTVKGAINGVVDETHIPKFNISINSEDASFKYPDLPKSVRNVFIDAEINNTTGIAKDTYVHIEKLSFNIDEDRFNVTSKISELMGNTRVDAHMDGRMNLANISQAYPVPTDLNLSGILKADVTTAFDMASVEQKQYEKTKTIGNIGVKDFEYSSAEITNPVKLNNVAVSFDPEMVRLEEMNGITGQTDFDITGKISNLLGFMFNDEEVKGNFNLKSNTFALNDFMVDETTSTSETKSGESESTEEKIKIPSFLDVSIAAMANTVIYDNIRLKDVRGNLRIKDEKAILNNMTSSIFDGQMAFKGEVSTKEETPVFAMELDMAQLQIRETFEAMEMFQVLAPIAQVLEGKLDTEIKLSGNLTEDFTPDLLTLTGNLLANVMTQEIDTEQAPLLSSLDGKLDFVNLKELNLKDLKTQLSFENGLVSVKPFTVKYRDIAINVDGGHGFDKKLDYKATMDVPAKYLGKQVNDLIAQIDEENLETLTVPVTANIRGDYSSPNVSTDLTSGVKNLTGQLVEIQKQKLLNKGKDTATDLIGGLLSDNSSESDSTQSENATSDGVQAVLGGILGGNKSGKDSTRTGTDSLADPKKDPVKEAAKGILGGLFGKKKDTIQQE
ncbi:AsmA-like C-terminal region-containing protein [Ulvibacterium sp.]|uniref:AsmA-like C-terminal region-containing protein n=1 Tax=Ulvibacterium sp. TaxID=2665914 RepID=UPI002634336B|nr:AsmA-like C-terminal region-containing protein [Ulvibacterium sp.]